MTKAERLSPEKVVELIGVLAQLIYEYGPPSAAWEAEEAVAQAKALARRLRELEGALESATARLARAEEAARRYRDALCRLRLEAEDALRRG